ncbi:hypothetical protein ACFQX6_67685 [Streptosporangium lutulentum]
MSSGETDGSIRELQSVTVVLAFGQDPTHPPYEICLATHIMIVFSGDGEGLPGQPERLLVMI